MEHLRSPKSPSGASVRRDPSFRHHAAPKQGDHHGMSDPGRNAPDDYSYAYYELGPPKKHTNVPPYREGSYGSDHTYLTRYGTEENIYEEISDATRARMHAVARSLDQSLVEEVHRVQSGHRRVLEELNLSVEAMLMPDGSQEGSGECNENADLLNVGPTDDLLSPAILVDLDSGFSGSSSGASYRSAGGSLRRGPDKLRCDVTPKKARSGDGAPARGFWSRKGWKRWTGGFSSRHSTGCKQQNDEPSACSGIWEESVSEERGKFTNSTPLRRTGSQRSSENSWCSGSDSELSSEEGSDRSATYSSRGSGQLRSTLNKARTLWRSSGGSGHGQSPLDGASAEDGFLQNPINYGRLSRWFSIRRGSTHQYDVESPGLSKETPSPNKMPLLPEVAEETFFRSAFQQRRHLPPALPPPPPDLTSQQLKRRTIVAAIVHSENSYVATLQRLVNEYKRPLEESCPSILSGSKINALFHRLPEILQCHTLFRIALAESVRNWDEEERIGDVFVASFSKAIVLDIYSGFINNFSVAMDLVKIEAKRRSALADFLKVKQIGSCDRLSFFGLMVKPVQRFPQFILFLQDLLKHTPHGHHDRMSLQLALTQLESLAEMLNERKREAEQYQAFREMLRNITGKFSVRPLFDGGDRYLIREDNITQLEFNQFGMITKTKSRRLLLLNDLVVCVSIAPKAPHDERLSLKWSFPVSDIEIQDLNASPTLARILTASTNQSGSLKAEMQGGANTLCSEMSNLMHDYEVVSRISDLVGMLKCTYKDMTQPDIKRVLRQIQGSIRAKDEEMAWLDSCCLQLIARTRGGKEETFTFHAHNPTVKSEWIVELRLAQLALDPNNSPAWEVPEQELRPSTKMPLFVSAQRVYKSQHRTEVRCGCFYTVTSPRSDCKRWRSCNYLWISTSDTTNSHIVILMQNQQRAGHLKEVAAFTLANTQVSSVEYVKGQAPDLFPDTVWMGADNGRLLVYRAGEPEGLEEIGSALMADAITQIKYHCDLVYVALADGKLLVFQRNPADGSWLLEAPRVLLLGDGPVSSLLPIDLYLYAACGKKVWVLRASTGEPHKSFGIQHEHVGNVNLMAHSGIGLWVSLKNSSTVCLYHTETFKHLQDINVASNVTRVTSVSASLNSVQVTALLACKGLLWVGTNVGISLTIPLPRLEGVPIISGRVNISYHAHFGPILFLLALQPKSSHREGSVTELDLEEAKPSDSSKCNDRVVLRRKKTKEGSTSGRLSKTLPRGFNSSMSSSCSQGSGDVYGLYGDLMYVKGYEGEEGVATDPIYESLLRRSDPELAAIPGKVSTLDRRLRIGAGRPRSLDLSSWSVDSRSSGLPRASSGSEDSLAASEVANRNSKTLRGNAGGECCARRTVITVMGGRGYVNWRRPCCPSEKSKQEPNSDDAHLVIWELKL